LNVPNVIVTEDCGTKGSKRAPRIEALVKSLRALADRRKVRTVRLTRRKIRGVFFNGGLGTKYAIAELLAKRFPEELGVRLPPKRRPWMSEDSRMAIFDAVALLSRPVP